VFFWASKIVFSVMPNGYMWKYSVFLLLFHNYPLETEKKISYNTVVYAFLRKEQP